MVKESTFASEMKKSFEYRGAFYFKIPDSYAMDRFSPPKLFDAIALYDGLFFALEYKIHKTETSFPFSKVREIQEKSLMDIHLSGGNAYIIINLRTKNYNCAIAINIEDWMTIKNHCIKDLKRKSIPWSCIKELVEFELKPTAAKTPEELMDVCRKLDDMLLADCYVFQREKYKNGTFWALERFI